MIFLMLGFVVGLQSNFLQLICLLIFLLEKCDDEFVVKYLFWVEEVIFCSFIVVMLLKNVDIFLVLVLRSYMCKFMFYGDFMDMVIRKFFMEVELFKEMQYIDCCL